MTGGHGFDIVFDTVGGATLDSSFVAVKRYTRHGYRMIIGSRGTWRGQAIQTADFDCSRPEGDLNPHDLIKVCGF
jgi:NADPH:quinone reductase-like Zn-dependent oxidoreductase